MHRNKIDMPRTKRLTRRAFALYTALVLVCCATTPVFAVITNNNSRSALESRTFLDKNGVPWAITVPGYVRLRTDGTTWLADRLEMDKPIVVNK